MVRRRPDDNAWTYFPAYLHAPYAATTAGSRASPPQACLQHTHHNLCTTFAAPVLASTSLRLPRGYSATSDLPAFPCLLRCHAHRYTNTHTTCLTRAFLPFCRVCSPCARATPSLPAWYGFNALAPTTYAGCMPVAVART